MLTLGFEPHVWVCAVILAHHGDLWPTAPGVAAVVANVLYPGANFQEHPGHPPPPHCSLLRPLSFTLEHCEWSVYDQKTNDTSCSPAYWVGLAFMVIINKADPLRQLLEARIHGNTVDDAVSGVSQQPAVRVAGSCRDKKIPCFRHKQVPVSHGIVNNSSILTFFHDGRKEINQECHIW